MAAAAAILLPPDVANKKDLLLSTQVYDIVDLLCEGPIYGFVDSSGVLVSGIEMAKAMYMNDVPLMNSDEFDTVNYQYINIQYMLGDEIQVPLTTPSNISKEKTYGDPLIGPWNWTSGNPTGIETIDARKYAGLNIEYGKWWKTQIGSGEIPYSAPMPILHEIDNYWVDAARLNLTVSSLYNINNTSPVQQNVGRKMPSYINYNVEYGVRDINGAMRDQVVKNMTITGIVDSPYGLSVDIDLSTFNRVEGESVVINIYKTTAETISPLIGRSMSLDSVVEIVTKYPMTYPFSALVGLTMDARTFRSPPQRSYLLRGKTIRIPSNYYPLQEADNEDLTGAGPFKLNSMDMREYPTGYMYAAHVNGVETPTGQIGVYPPAQIYKGNWDGTFKMGWTDNPVWVLFDLLVNNVYGLGDMIDVSMIDKWTLYQIGRYADAVDDAGYFVGLKTLEGGLEPRYTCNVIIDTEQAAYDLINYIAGIFRGVAYWFGGGIYFADDRPKDPIMYFGNADVKDGIFAYQEAIKNSRFTVSEISYNDRNDKWLPKTEYVEDADGILNFGIIKNSSVAFGVTSRSEARRLGLYQLYSSRLEPEIVSFSASHKASYLRPGDIIGISDEIKQIKRYNGILKGKRISGDRLYFDLDAPLPLDIASGDKLIVSLPWGFAQPTDFDAANTGIPGYAISSTRTKQTLIMDIENISTNRQTVDLTGNQFQVYNATEPSAGDLVLDPDASVTKMDLEDAFNYIPPYSLFIASGSGSTPYLYRVISINEEVSSSEFSVSATQFEPRKFEIIENEKMGVDLSNPYSSSSINLSLTKPNPVGNLFLQKTGVSGSLFDVNVSWDQPVIPPMLAAGPPTDPYPYTITLTDPNGKKLTQQTSGLNTTFSGFTTSGNYSVQAWSVGVGPYYLNSNAASTSIIIGPNDFESNFVSIFDISIRNSYSTTYDASYHPTGDIFTSAGSGTGSAINTQGNVNLAWALGLPDGTLISGTSNNINSVFDVSQDIYVLDPSMNIKEGLTIKGYKSTSLTFNQTDLESAFGEYPRNFYVMLLASGNNAPITTPWSGIFNVANPTLDINDMSVSDFTGTTYWSSDLITNINNNSTTGEIDINIEFVNQGYGDAVAVRIYTGSSSGFSPDNTNLYSRIILGNNTIDNQQLSISQGLYNPSGGPAYATPFYLQFVGEDSIGTGSIFLNRGIPAIFVPDPTDTDFNNIIFDGQFMYGQKIFSSVAGTPFYSGTGFNSGSGRFGVGLPIENWSSLSPALQAIFNPEDTISGSGIFPRSEFHVIGDSLFQGNVNITGNLTVTGSVRATGSMFSPAFNVTSDKNVKTKIQKIAGALGILKNIDGVTFDYKQTNMPSAGVLAQQVEEVFPMAVTQRPASPEEELIFGLKFIKCVNYNALIPLLIESIKEIDERSH